MRKTSLVNRHFTFIAVCSNLLRETKHFDFSHPENIMDSTFGKSFLFLTKLAWNCKVTLPVLVTAVFLAMDFRMQIELNIETEQLVFQVFIFILFNVEKKNLNYRKKRLIFILKFFIFRMRSMTPTITRRLKNRIAEMIMNMIMIIQ